MEHRTISHKEQIDAVLGNNLWALKERLYGGSVPALQASWKVSFDEIVAVARERGLASLVQENRGGQGVFLLRCGGGYEVHHMERAASIFSERFTDLEPAFSRWLHHVLQEYGLLSKAGR